MHADTFLRETAAIAERIDREAIERMAQDIAFIRGRGGRLFLIGLGGSAANCSHAAADFRKLCGIQAQAPTDNMAEFSARANDDGFSSVFSGWLEASDASNRDGLLVMSVGGGTSEVSMPLVRALDYAGSIGMYVFGIVGPNGGATAKAALRLVTIPVDSRVTPHTEAFQAVIWHCLVSHPILQRNATKW